MNGTLSLRSVRASLVFLFLASVAFAEAEKPRTSFGPKDVLTTAVVIKIDPTREGESTTFPAGSPVRILKSSSDGKAVILIGETREQAIVPKTAIVEAGGTGGSPITVMSIQPPTRISMVRLDGPEGIWTGIATGDENVTPRNPRFEQEILRLTNLERTKRGLAPLVWDEDLARAARYHAADMYVQEYSGHETKDTIVRNGKHEGSIVREDVKDRTTRFATYAKGENVQGWPCRTPEEAVTKWMNSKGHRENILNPRFKKLGVGFITQPDGTPAWGCRAVQVFGI